MFSVIMFKLRCWFDQKTGKLCLTVVSVLLKIGFGHAQNWYTDVENNLHQPLLKIIWWQFLVPHSERFLVSSAILLCKTKYFDFLTYALPGLFSLLIKISSVSEQTSSFWIFIVSCCSLILWLPNKVSSEGLFRYV